MYKEAEDIIHISVQVVIFAAFTLVLATLFAMARQAVSAKSYNDGVASVVVEAGEYYKYFGDNRVITTQNMISFISLYGDNYGYVIQLNDKFYSTEDKNIVEKLIGSSIPDTKYRQINYSIKGINSEIYIKSDINKDAKFKATLYAGNWDNMVKVSSDGANAGTLVHFKLQ